MRVLLDEVAAETRRNLQLIGATSALSRPGPALHPSLSPSQQLAAAAAGPSSVSAPAPVFGAPAPGSASGTPRTDESLVLRMVRLHILYIYLLTIFRIGNNQINKFVKYEIFSTVLYDVFLSVHKDYISVLFSYAQIAFIGGSPRIQ